MFKLFQENKSISWIASQNKYIDYSPTYQRMSNVWNKEQKQLLIDSIINGFDIPKLYFQFLPPVTDKKMIYNYAVIDGKQRLEAIFDFMNDKISLSKEFKYINNENEYFDISGKTFSEIDVIEPSIISKFLNYELCIVFMDTDDPETINETFIRLNSGMVVNTAEKRNAIGGELARNMKKLYTTHPFYTKKLKMTNMRYAHFDLALKMLMIEMGYDDLSRKTVDIFVEQKKAFGQECQAAFRNVVDKLDRMTSDFDDKDKLLVKKSMIVTLYSIVDVIPDGHIKSFLHYFETHRNNCMSETEKDETDALMIEFSRHLQQGADKRVSLENRRNIMNKYLHIYLVSALGYI